MNRGTFAGLAPVWLGLLLLPALRGMAQEAAKPAKPERLSLLHDRLSAVFPAGARDEARGHDIMAADESTERETRVVVDDGKRRFVILCTELFQNAGPDFAQAVRRYLANFPDAMKPLETRKAVFQKPGLTGMRIIPGKRDARTRAILIETLLVRNEDGTAQTLSFYINPDALPELPAYQKSVAQIIGSLQAGTRRLRLTARPVLIDRVGQQSLTLDLPQGYVLTTQNGPDFTVNRICKLGTLGASVSSFGIYIGGYPEPLKKEQAVAGTLFGKPVEWQRVTSPKGALRFGEQVQVPHPLQEDTVLHLFIDAATAPERDAMQRIAATLRVTKAPAAAP